MALSLLCMFATASIAEVTEETSYPFGIKPEKMQAIDFTDGSALHDYHIEEFEEMDMDCTACHSDEENYTFMNMAQMHSADQETRTAYVHKSCVDCHVKLNDGPKITACRSCHAVAKVAVTE